MLWTSSYYISYPNWFSSYSEIKFYFINQKKPSNETKQSFLLPPSKNIRNLQAKCNPWTSNFQFPSKILLYFSFKIPMRLQNEKLTALSMRTICLSHFFLRKITIYIKYVYHILFYKIYMLYVTMYIICIPGLYYIIYYSYINIKICKDLSKVHLEISHTYFYVVIDFSALSRYLFSMTLFYWTLFYTSSSWIRWIWWLFTKKLRITIREWELREESRVLGITRRQ